MPEPRLDLVTLLVDDVAAGARFYREALGFTLLKDRGDYVELGSGGARLALYPRSALGRLLGRSEIGEPRRGQAVNLSFAVGSEAAVEELYRRVLTRGARPIQEPARMPWGPHAAFFLDPDGNLVEVFAHPDASREE